MRTSRQKRRLRKRLALVFAMAVAWAALCAGARAEPVEANTGPYSRKVSAEKLARYWDELDRKFSTDDLEKIAQTAGILEELDVEVIQAYKEQKRIREEYLKAMDEYWKTVSSYSDQQYKLAEEEDAARRGVEAVILAHGERLDEMPAKKVDEDKVHIIAGHKRIYFDPDTWEAEARANAQKVLGKDPEKLQGAMADISRAAQEYNEQKAKLDQAKAKSKAIYETLEKMRPEDPASRPVRYQYGGFRDFLFVRSKPDLVLLDRVSSLTMHAELVRVPTPDPTPPPPGVVPSPSPVPTTWPTPTPTPTVEWSLWENGKQVFGHTEKVGDWYKMTFLKAGGETSGVSKARRDDEAGGWEADVPPGQYTLYAMVKLERGEVLVDRRELIYVGGTLPVEIPADIPIDEDIFTEMKAAEDAYTKARKEQGGAIADMRNRWARLSSDLSGISKANEAEAKRREATKKVRMAGMDFYAGVAKMYTSMGQTGGPWKLYGGDAQKQRMKALRAARIAAKHHLKAANDRARIKLREGRVQFWDREQVSGFGADVRALYQVKEGPPLELEPGEQPGPSDRWKGKEAKAPKLSADEIRELRDFGLSVSVSVDDVVGMSGWERMEDERWAREELELALGAWGVTGLARQAFAQVKQLAVMQEEITRLGAKPLVDNANLLKAKAEVVRVLAEQGIGAVLKYEAASEDLLEQQKSYFGAFQDIGKGFVEAWNNKHEYMIQDATEFFILTAKTPYALFDVFVGFGSDMAIMGANYCGADWKTREDKVQERIKKLNEETTAKVEFLEMIVECDERQLVTLNQWHKGKRDIFNKTGIRLPPSESGLGYNMLIKDRRFAEMTNGGLTRILGAIDIDPKEARANELRIAEDMTRLTRMAGQSAHYAQYGRDPKTGDFVWSSLLKPATAISTQYRALFQIGSIVDRNQYLELKRNQEHEIGIVRAEFADCGYDPDPAILKGTAEGAFAMHERLLATNPDYVNAWVNIENCEFVRQMCYLTRLTRELEQKPQGPETERLRKSYEHKIKLCAEASRVNLAQAEPLVLKLRYRDAILGYDYHKALSLLDQMRRQRYVGQLASIKGLKLDRETMERARFDDNIFQKLKESSQQYKELQENDAKYEELKRAIQWEITIQMGTDVLENWGNMGFYAAGFNAFFTWAGVPAGGTGPASFLQYLYGVVNPFSGAMSSWAGLGQVVGNIVEEAAEEVISEAFQSSVYKNQNWGDFLGMLSVEVVSAMWRKGMSRMEEREGELEQETKPEVRMRNVEELPGAAWQTIKSVKEHPFYKAMGEYLSAASKLASAGTEAEQKVQRDAMNEAGKVLWDYIAVWEAARKRWSLQNLLAEIEYVKGAAQSYSSAANYWAARMLSRIKTKFDYERWVGEVIRREVEAFRQKLQEQGQGKRADLAAELLRKIDPVELKRIRGVEYKGEVFLSPEIEAEIVAQVQFLVEDAMSATAKEFPGEVVGFVIEGSSADPASPEFKGLSSDNDVSVLVKNMNRREEVKAFFDTYLKKKLVTELELWHIECFANAMPEMDTTKADWDMKAANDNLLEVMRGVEQAEAYMTVGQLRMLKLIGKLRGKIWVADGKGGLSAAPREHEIYGQVYGDVKLETGDGLDIVLDQEHFVRRYEQALAEDPRALAYALAKYNIREIVGAMASVEAGRDILNNLSAENAAAEGGPHGAFVKAAQEYEGPALTQEQRRLAVRWQKLKIGMPLQEVFKQMLTVRLNELEAEHEKQNKPFDREEWKETVLDIIVIEHLETGKRLRARFLNTATAGRRQYEAELKTKATELQAKVDEVGTPAAESEEARNAVMRITQEMDQRSHALAVMMRRLSQGQIEMLRAAQLRRGNPPDFLAIDATILMSQTITFESAGREPIPEEEHVGVDKMDMGKGLPDEPQVMDIATTVPGAKPPVDPKVVLKQMIERERCPHW